MLVPGGLIFFHFDQRKKQLLKALFLRATVEKMWIAVHLPIFRYCGFGLRVVPLHCFYAVRPILLRKERHAGRSIH